MKKWLENIPLIGFIYLIIMGFRLGWDTEIEDDVENSAYMGLSSALVIFVLILIGINIFV